MDNGTGIFSIKKGSSPKIGCSEFFLVWDMCKIGI